MLKNSQIKMKEKPSLSHYFEALVADYYQFLKDKTIIEEVAEDWVQITTPFLNTFHDSIELYAKRQVDKILLSDDGQTLRHLKLNTSAASKQQEQLRQICATHGVKLKKDELIVWATPQDFAQKMFCLLSAVLEIGSLSQPTAWKFRLRKSLN